MNYVNYVAERVVEDKDEVKSILEFAMDDIYKKFDIKMKRPEQALAIFSVTLTECIKKLKEKSESNYSKYKIIIANRVEIGFDNSLNADYEKNGGFIVYLRHLYHEKADDDISREYEDETIALCSAWNSVNITTDSGIIKEIAISAYKELNALELKLGSSEPIMPIFVSVYDAIISYMKIRRAELKEFEFSINFGSLFEIRVQEDEDLDDMFIFTPSIQMKLAMKSDASATSMYE